MELDKSRLAAPLYLQIFTQLKKDIEIGKYGIGELIPSENQLIEDYGVSRMTARLAVLELVKFDLVERKRGTGTIVKASKVEESLKRVTSFTEEMQSNNVVMITPLCTIEKIVAPYDVRKNLDLTENAEVYKLIRLRSNGQYPLVYSVTYLNIENLEENCENYKSSLYDYLRRNHDVVIVNAKDQLEAVTCSSDIEKLLEIKKKAPVFKRTRIGFAQRNKKVEYSISYYPGERYKYSVEL